MIMNNIKCRNYKLIKLASMPPKPETLPKQVDVLLFENTYIIAMQFHHLAS